MKLTIHIIMLCGIMVVAGCTCGQSIWINNKIDCIPYDYKQSLDTDKQEG